MDKLDTYFLEYNNIDKKTPHCILYMQPEQLINSKRIDIIVKYIYIRAKETGENISFAREIYKNHIEAFSDGTFSEPGNKNKTSIEDYFKVFDFLIDDIKENGFDEELSLIPLGNSKEILDGSHRTACALYFKQEVKVVQFQSITVDYGFEFFKKRLLDDFYLDAIAREYVRLKKNVRLLFVWPRVGTDENIGYVEAELKKDKFNILYKKNIKLDKDQLWNLLFNIYKDEHWMSSSDGFKGINEKTEQCFGSGGVLKLYLLEETELELLTSKKEQLRQHFNVGKSSVHSTDTTEESIEIIDALLDHDYNDVLHKNFVKSKDRDYTVQKRLKRKLRYVYRTSINKMKSLLGKPV